MLKIYAGTMRHRCRSQGIHYIVGPEPLYDHPALFRAETEGECHAPFAKAPDVRATDMGVAASAEGYFLLAASARQSANPFVIDIHGQFAP